MRGRYLTVVWGMLAGTAVLAQTPGSVLTVRVQVVRSCVLNAHGPDSSSERVVVQCTGTAAPKAELSATMNQAASQAPAPRTSDDSGQTAGDAPADVIASEAGSSPAPSNRPFRMLTINF